MKKHKNQYCLGTHLGLVAAIYTLISLIGNGILFKRHLDRAQLERKRNGNNWLAHVGKEGTTKAVAGWYLKNPPTSVKIFNGIVAACFITDLCLYPVAKKIIEKS